MDQVLSEYLLSEKDAINYSISFETNRIRREQLLDLSRPILADMGITKVGDAIMKHAKEVHEQEQRMLAMASRYREEDHHETSSRLMINSQAASVLPHVEASWRGVQPFALTAFTSQPLPTNSLTNST